MPTVYVYNVKLDELDVIYPRDFIKRVFVTSRGGVPQSLDFNELTKTHMNLYACTHSRRTREPKTRKGRKNAHAMPAQRISKEELGVA